MFHIRAVLEDEWRANYEALKRISENITHERIYKAGIVSLKHGGRPIEEVLKELCEKWEKHIQVLRDTPEFGATMKIEAETLENCLNELKGV